MKKIYNKKAWYLDENVLILGYVNKYGFHPAKNISCGFSLQRINKKMIGKQLFYKEEDVIKSNSIQLFFK